MDAKNVVTLINTKTGVIMSFHKRGLLLNKLINLTLMKPFILPF